MLLEETLKVLLVEDDKDDYFLTKSLFLEIQGQRFQITWLDSYAKGLEQMPRNQHDVCLVDYQLGAHNGIELLREAQERGCQAPIILLTGQGEHQIDIEAMKAGAADYLVKGRLDPGLLERSIRYAIERKRAAMLAAAEQARLAAFGADVGLALTRSDSLETILNRCAAAMVQSLHCALARIWIFEPEEQVLALKARAGLGSSPGEQAPPATLSLPSCSIAGNKPFLANLQDETLQLADRDYPLREGLVAYAGYPLMLEDRLVGLISLFARHPLTRATLQELGSVVNGVALCIERKRSEQALDASEVRYRSVLETVTEVIFQTNREGAWEFLSPAWTEITRHPVKECLGTDASRWMHPEDREPFRELIEHLADRQQSYGKMELRCLARDGSERWFQLLAQPLLDENEFGTSGTLVDITHRKAAEAEIQKLAAFPRFNPDPVMEIAADGRISYVNQAAQKLTGEFAFPSAERLLPSGATATAQECLRSNQSKLEQQVTFEGRTLSWSFFPIAASKVVHCYGTDITQRLTLEAQFRHAQKLESIGQLAAGVAHDFNNILTIITGHSDRLLSVCDGEQRLTDPLKQISEAARRAASLTRQLLMFSRKQLIQPRVLNVNNVLANMVDMLQRLLGEDIALSTVYQDDMPHVEADMGMVEQVIMNLAVNARDAMPKGGQLLITTSGVEIDDMYVQQHAEARCGSMVSISVTDTGCGMDTTTLSKIFEPFFTTKEVGKGTGLGLATVYGIVRQHQGWVQVSSEVNVGTTFRIFLPSTTKAAEASSGGRKLARDVRGGTETILLVEDEPVLRELAKMVLHDYRYRVLEAGTGREALEVWAAQEGKIDLLLTDMIMPEGITGRELAERLRRENPSLKVIFTSGYSPEIMGREEGDLCDTFLQKPYPPPQLAQVVRECLDLRGV